MIQHDIHIYNTLKTTDEVGCLNILMISLNENISVTFARKVNRPANRVRKKTGFVSQKHMAVVKIECEHQQTFNIFCILVPIHLFHQPDKLS